MKINGYLRFGLMMLASFLIMYAIMFLNVARLDHVMLSLMRTYMTLLMVSSMAITMLLFMLDMYSNKRWNAVILLVSGIVFVGVFYMERHQTGISDVQYMKAMIPHHSSAILTSRQANLKDPEVRQLASEIIKAQEREIAQMKAAIARLQNK